MHLAANCSSNASAVVHATAAAIVVFKSGGCGGANPPANEIWARVNGTTSFDVSASQCTASLSTATLPPTPPSRAPTPDGSRVFFTTTQQLVNGDTDQTNDIYACDIPSGNPAPTRRESQSLRRLQADLRPRDPSRRRRRERLSATSEDGSTVLFTAKGVLADNEDALGEKAVAGDHNLYVWRADAAHPDGQTTFVGRLDPDDLVD